MPVELAGCPPFALIIGVRGEHASLQDVAPSHALAFGHAMRRDLELLAKVIFKVAFEDRTITFLSIAPTLERDDDHAMVAQAGEKLRHATAERFERERRRVIHPIDRSTGPAAGHFFSSLSGLGRSSFVSPG